MNRIHLSAVAAATILVTLSACASSTPSTTPTLPTPTATKTPSATPRPTPTPTHTPTPTMPAGAIALGKVGRYTSAGTTWDITLVRTRCGLTTIPGAALNPKWNGANGSQYVAVHASKGMRFCQLQWRWTNRSSAAITIGMGGDLLLDSQHYRRPSQDYLWSVGATKTQTGTNLTDPVPAGATVQRIDLYEVPTGHIPTGVWAPNGPNPLLFAIKA